MIDDKPKNKSVLLRINEHDHKDLTEIADRNGMDLSKLIRYSVEPYILKKKYDNILKGLENKEIIGLDSLVKIRHLLKNHLQIIDQIRNDLQLKIDNIDLAEKIVMDKVENKQLNLRFNKIKTKKKLVKA